MSSQRLLSSEPEEAEAKLPIVRKRYLKPQITHEFDLETKAGSPLGIDPADPGLLNPFDN